MKTGVKIVHNKILGGWYIVHGAHHTFISGKFASKEEARAHLNRNKNPAPYIGTARAHLNRNKNPAPYIGTARPRRVSQITKRPPSKHLVVRRLRDTRKGYFPNPVTDKFIAAVAVDINKKRTIICVTKNTVYASQIAQLLTEEKAIAGAKFSVIKIPVFDYLGA